MSKRPHETALPKLRFPEFRDAQEWFTPTLREISEPVTGKIGSLPLPTVSISAGTGFVLQSEKFGRDISGEQYKNYIRLSKGEFSYNKGNSKRFPEGCIYQLKEFEQVAVPNVFFSFRFKNGFLPTFYQGYFDNNFHGQQLKKNITSGARSNGLLNISSKSFFSIVLPTPRDIAEQQKIAAALSSLEALLTAQTAKLTALQAHKRGLMQALFPAEGETVPKRRFPEFQGDWKKEKLGKLVEMKGRIGYRGYTVADIVEKGKGAISLSPGNITREGNLDFNKCTFISWEKYDESPEIMLRDGFTVFVKTGYSYGKAALISNLPEKTTINPQLVVLKPTHVNAVFLHLLVCHPSVQKQINERISGGDIPSLSQETISKFDVLKPTEAEQQKIADCLSSLGNLITAQSEKIEVLKLHKKGLMQALFPAASEQNA